MTLIRGRRSGLEIALAGRDLSEAFEELEARLAEQPDFYRGSVATATFGSTCPSAEDIARLQTLLGAGGVSLRAIAGASELATVASEYGLAFETQLSESARSLIADFAGARSDIAERRKRGEASVPRLATISRAPRETASLHAVAMPPGTLYHTQTLRGGQALHHAGNIVVVGDVNPGAELIATGDIVVFGRLAGVAHAGAQGDTNARVYAIDLDATQLRIATLIAADNDGAARIHRPEAALISEERILVVSLDQLGQFEPQSGASVS